MLGILCVAGYRSHFNRWVDRELISGKGLVSELPYLEELGLVRLDLSNIPIGPSAVALSPARPYALSLRTSTSPDGSYTVFTRTFLYDHHSFIRNESTGELTPLISIREPDPWSGSAHGHHWSADSKAVYFIGQGSDRDGKRMPLPLIYLVDSDEFIVG